MGRTPRCSRGRSGRQLARAWLAARAAGTPRTRSSPDARLIVQLPAAAGGNRCGSAGQEEEGDRAASAGMPSTQRLTLQLPASVGPCSPAHTAPDGSDARQQLPDDAEPKAQRRHAPQRVLPARQQGQRTVSSRQQRQRTASSKRLREADAKGRGCARAQLGARQAVSGASPHRRRVKAGTAGFVLKPLSPSSCTENSCAAHDSYGERSAGFSADPRPT